MSNIVNPYAATSAPLAVVIITPNTAHPGSSPGCSERVEYCVVIPNVGTEEYWRNSLAAMLRALVSAYKIFSLPVDIQVIPFPFKVGEIVSFKSMFVTVYIKGGIVPDDIVIPKDLVG